MLSLFVIHMQNEKIVVEKMMFAVFIVQRLVGVIEGI